MENQSVDHCHVCCEPETTVGKLDLITEDDRIYLTYRYSWMESWTKLCSDCIVKCKSRPTPHASDDNGSDVDAVAVVDVDDDDDDDGLPALIPIAPTHQDNVIEYDIHTRVEDLILPLFIPEELPPELPLPLQLALLPPNEELIHERANVLAASSASVRNHTLNSIWSMVGRRTAELRRAARLRRRIRGIRPPPHQNTDVNTCDCPRCLRIRIPYEWAHSLSAEEYAAYYGDDDEQ